MRREKGLLVTHLQGLSPRQRAILRLLIKGMANKEIARRLWPPCAEATLRRISRTFTASSASRTAQKPLRRGLEDRGNDANALPRMG